MVLTSKHEITAVDSRFSTPILTGSVSGFDLHRDGVIALVRSIMEEDCLGITSSNFDGWHSARNMHLRDDDETRWLVRTLSRLAVRMVREVSPGVDGLQLIVKESWYNCHSQGGWNMPHTHPAAWSGVLYIDGDFAPDGGELMFFNPVPQSRQTGLPDHLVYKPEAGKLILFPGFLQHMVAPYKSAGRRISMSFNIDPVGL